MKRLLRATLSTLSFYAMRLVGRRGEPAWRMLTYHRVTDAHPDDRLCVPVERFAAQMRYLHQHEYRTIPFAEAVRWIVEGGTLPARAVVVTFDDGFEDNYLYAAPAMERFGFAGIFFVPTAFIESQAHAHHHLDDRPMTWTHLAELLARGHEIGGHSVSHRKLTRIDQDARLHEVQGCKRALERHLQRPIEFFCYPAGDCDESVKRLVQASGYRGACTVEPGANRRGDDPFALKRTEISGRDSLWDFEKKLAGAYDWLHVAVQLAHRWSPSHRRHPSNVVEVKG